MTKFAFSIPIVILLLLFINDHYRFYKLRNKVKSSAYLAASMMQQIGNTRTSKQLTTSDLARITYASCLNMFHTDSMVGSHPFGIYYLVYIWYVKRINKDNYQLQFSYSTTSPTSVANLGKGARSIVTLTQIQVQTLHTDLVCDKDGDERVLIGCWYNGYHFEKSKLGFHILTPQFGKIGDDPNALGNFSYTIVITPKPGLFPIAN